MVTATIVETDDIEQHMRSWEPVEKNIESIAEKVWKMTQSGDTKGKNPEQGGDIAALGQRKSMDQRQRGHGQTLERKEVIKKDTLPPGTNSNDFGGFWN